MPDYVRIVEKIYASNESESSGTEYNLPVSDELPQKDPGLSPGHSSQSSSGSESKARNIYGYRMFLSIFVGLFMILFTQTLRYQ